MDSPARPSSSDRAALWRAKKEEIGVLVARGLDVNEIEEHLQRDGSRVTAPVREYIIWEKRSPEVRTLLAQGLSVEAVEEQMRLGAWLWTDTLRKKALWEFHREEIIRLYKTLQSVEAVQKVMVKKGFTPQTRIYYEWLRYWGIPTSIHRNVRPEMALSSHVSPFASNDFGTPGSVPVPPAEAISSEFSPSPLAHRVGPNIKNLAQHIPGPLDSVVDPNEEGAVNMYQPDGAPMDVDESYDMETTRDFTIWPNRTGESFASPNYLPQGSQRGRLGGHLPSTENKSFFDDCDSDSSEDGDICHYTSQLAVEDKAFSNPNNNTEVALPWVDHHAGTTLQNNSEQTGATQRRVIHPNAARASQQIFRVNMNHRTSADSGYASKTSSMQSNSVGGNQKSRSGSNLRDSSFQAPNYTLWTFDKNQLHAVCCLIDHQVRDFEFNCCGSSMLQELGAIASNMPVQQVYELLCNYMRLKGARNCDSAGNTFLHKIAVIGAPWEYFEAAFEAGVDPCHQNAYGQTFAHVLNVVKLQDNLIQCFSRLQALGIDFHHRDASGRTVFHCLYAQPISPQTSLNFLQFFDPLGRQISLRDVSGNTPYEMFKRTYLRETSRNPRWSTTEPHLQIIGQLEDIVNNRLWKLRDDTHDGMNAANIFDDKLQSQYKKVIDNGMNGIITEAVDGSNAFHAQAALVSIIHDAADDLGSLKYFIKLGIDSNAYDNFGKTPLEATIIQPRNYEAELTTSEKVSVLIDEGKANIHSRNRLGHTPLYSAAIRGLDRTVEVLLKRNSHINIRANDGTSLLDAVSDAKDRAFVEYYESGLCEYHEAQCSRIEACKILLERYGAVSNPTEAQAMGYPMRMTPVLL